MQQEKHPFLDGRRGGHGLRIHIILQQLHRVYLDRIGEFPGVLLVHQYRGEDRENQASRTMRVQNAVLAEISVPLFLLHGHV
jgi:hypothetical protein